MPTQEERLSTLEKFQKEAAAHIRETEENTTILLGVIRDQGRDIKRTVQRLDTIDGRLDTIDGGLNTLDGRLNTIDGGLNTLDGRLNTLEQHMESRFETLEQKFDQALHLLTTLTTRLNQ
jgi:chromosome segregation ATPase